MEKIEYETLDKIPNKKSCEKFNYFYKIINELNGKYYYGVHSTFNLNDGYMGSSKALKKDIKINGVKNFKKYILKFFNDSDKMYSYEKEIVTKNVVLEKKCYNQHTGGNGSWDFTLGKVCVKDISGNTMMVDKDDEDYVSGKLISNMSGLIHVKTKDGKSKTITKEEYYQNKDKYSALICGNILAKNENNISKWVDKNTFDKLKKEGKLFGQTKNKGVFKDANGNYIMCDLNDERVISGELVGSTKGIGVYKYRNDFSKIVTTTKDDERVLNGELVGINYGIVYCINPETKETFSVFKNDERIKNGEIMTITKYNRLIGKVKGNGKSPKTLEYYKEKYPVAMDCIEKKENYESIIKKTGLTRKKIDYLRTCYKKLHK